MPNQFTGEGYDRAWSCKWQGDVWTAIHQAAKIDGKDPTNWIRDVVEARLRRLGLLPPVKVVAAPGGKRRGRRPGGAAPASPPP